jgi:hypothetical protein
MKADNMANQPTQLQKETDRAHRIRAILAHLVGCDFTEAADLLASALATTLAHNAASADDAERAMLRLAFVANENSAEVARLVRGLRK